MNLYLVRHGSTDDWENKVRQGKDSKLGEKGIKQVEKLAERLGTIKFDVLLASDWARAMKTAEIIAKKINIPVNLNEGLREQGENPKLSGAAYEDQINKDYLEDVFKNGHADMDWKFRGEGESMKEMISRMKKFKEEMMNKYRDKTVLVVSHGAFLSTLIPYLFLGDEIADEILWKVSFSFRKQENTGLTFMVFNEERMTWQIRYFNETSHLSALGQL